ncbi:NADPH-dependent oxidoreductase 2-alkenal reductase-like [Rutidosis leptorrhynchoides]|uniref:NADPH-dependent oxidoreductase 2-alkenal reductase-like n=1 Tax=Rutidosis leptorrhynchoides TaxID=125765 RepID=UPI003A98F87F
MEMVQSKFVTIKTHIEEAPQESMFDIKTQTISTSIQPETNDVIVKCLYLSIDPYQLNRMKSKSSSQNTVADASKITPGMMINGGGLGRVIASGHPDYQKNDIVCGSLNWAEYTVVNNGNMLMKVNNIEFPLSYHVGVFGSSGLTAYGGFFRVCKPKKGDKVFVSAAAGSVGNLVGQYAKLYGCYVVGCAGTKEKVELLKGKLGFDEAFNYKGETDLNSTLKRYFPNGIDIYFDNVGGEMLEAAVANMNSFGKIAVCGVISDYTNSGRRTAPSMIDIIYKRIMIQGFLVSDFYTDELKDFMPVTKDYVRGGKLCVLEDISCGIECIPGAFVGLFRGENVGKKIVKMDEE